MRVTLNRRKKVAVIGGGITGLTAAFYLQKEAQQNNLPIDVIVIEASLRLGGKIQTLRKNGFVIERGPESFLDHHLSVSELASDLGIKDQLINNNPGITYVAVGKDLYPIPNMLFDGSLKVSSFLTSGIFSLMGKVRAAGDLLLSKSSDSEDEPIGDFFRRRFGKEVVENLVEPLMAGTFAGDIDHLSLRSMFPEIYQLEKEHRSLIVGMKKRGHFYDGEHVTGYQSFAGGMGTLVEALEANLPEKSILKGVKVEEIDKLSDGTMQIFFNNIAPLKCDAVIMTTPFNETKNILGKYGTLEEMSDMKFATIATVTMAFKKEHIEKYKDAINFFVSRNSDFVITTGTWCNHKWPNVSPKEYDLFRVYIGRVGDEAVVELSDTNIEKTVHEDLKRAFGLKNDPAFTIVTRWKQSMPQYTIGHETRMQSIRNILNEEFPHIKLVGSSYEGISVPDCVMQGKKCAEQLLNELFQLQHS